MKPEIEKVVDQIIKWAEEKKAENIVKIDVGERSYFTDALIICDGMNEIHLQAIANNIKDEARKNDLQLLAIEGYENASWILMDFIDVIVHLFNKEARQYYRLEDLWNITSKNKETIELNNDKRQDQK